MGNNCKKSTSSSPSTTESTSDRVSSHGGNHPQIDRASRPALRDLATHVIPGVKTSWYNLGLQLLDPKYENELNTIEAGTRNDAATSCRKMFSKWLNTDELASWDKLIKALRVVQLNDVVNDIEQLLLQGDAEGTIGSVTNSNQPGSSSRVGDTKDTTGSVTRGNQPGSSSILGDVEDTRGSVTSSNQSDSSSILGDDTKNVEDLRKYFVSNYAAKWKRLAQELGVKKEDIDDISNNNSHLPKKCCNAMLDQWQKETRSSSWRSKLCDAIRNIKQSSTTSHDKEDNHGDAKDKRGSVTSSNQPGSSSRVGDARDTRSLVTSRHHLGSNNRVGDDTPNMRDLHSNYVEQYAAHWERLGLELGLKNYHIANISKNNPKSAEECCVAVFEKWLREIPSPTYDKLDDAVKNIKRSSTTRHGKEGDAKVMRGSVTSSNQPASSSRVDNVVDWLSDNMKGRYCSMRLKKRKEEKDSWPPIKTKSYVTLAIVHQKELQTRKETTATIYLRTKGDIHEIPHTIGTDKLTDITQIFDPVSGRVPNSILIEGHAGIGKTTFVKETCIEWAEGKLLTSDKLVLLLLLRDPNVQKITNEHKLIEHFTKSTSKVEQLSSYLEDNHGAGITLIIDGFDELNTTLRQESFFRELIEKRCLPRAKIVVTSRPSASACLHDVVDRRLEILGFEQSSRNQYVAEALQDSPSKLEKLRRHFQQYPNIDAICYIPLIMSIIVFLCMCQPDELPPTATKMYASFILHTICHYLKREGKIPEDKVINKLEQFPPVVYKALQQLEKTAFDGLVKDKIVFTVEELPVLCKDDPTCYGLLQSTECYSAEEVGTPTQSFNFLHLGIQEYFSAKHVTTLPEDKVYTLLKESFNESFNVTDHIIKRDHVSKSIRLSNMWVLYCGITSGQCKTLRQYLDNPYYYDWLSNMAECDDNDDDDIDSQMTSGKMTGPSQQGSTFDQRISNTRTILQRFSNDPVKVLYLFQCFQEAQDNELCEVLSKSFDSGKIELSSNRLLPHQVVSLGFFLSRSHRKWKRLEMVRCYIGDHGMSIIHQYLCGDKTNKQEITEINLGENNLTGASSHLIADIISHLQPHTLDLYKNNITNVRDISTAVINTTTVKVLDMTDNDLTAQEAVAISDMMTCLERLYIYNNKLDDHGAELLSEGITNSKTLRILYISNNNIGPSGTTAIANALGNNTSLQRLVMGGNKVGKNEAKAIAEAITNNTTLEFLTLGDDTMDKESVMIIMRSLHCNNTITELNIPISLRSDDSVMGEVIKINNRRNECNVQELKEWLI